MDIISIRTTEEFLKKNLNNTALIYLKNGQSYETKSIYKIIEPKVGNFEPLIMIDVSPDGEDMAIIPTTTIHHIVIKGPEKEKKIGFFTKKTH